MDQIELNRSQREILTALIDNYQLSESLVSGEAIAEELDRNPGTIRNNMQSLTALNLVEGVPGVKGGYKPTVKAYEVLDVQDLDDPASLILARNYDRVTTTVEAIDFIDVNHPEQCRAVLRFQRSVDGLEPGDAILIGLTPVSKLVVGGEVVSADGARNEVLIDVVQVEAPLVDE